jgi:hypothetical protein
MIKNIIDLLNAGDYYGVSDNVDFAKGSRKIPYTWKQAKELIKRMWHGRKYK